jgi:lantibiotic modifying enzyme
MNTASLEKIEAEILRLDLNQQLELIEFLARQVRENSQKPVKNLESELSAMANDPEIQRELREIEDEFAETLLDGLRNEK